MTDSATLKKDLDTMIYYKKWLVAIVNRLEQELGDPWFSACEYGLRSIIGKFEWMIEECKEDIIAEEEMEA